MTYSPRKSDTPGDGVLTVNTFWLKSRGSGTALDNARVFGVKRKSMGVVLAMALAVLLLPLNSANATPPGLLTVTYTSGGADSGTPPTSPNVSSGDTLTVLSNTNLVRAGYTFAGWTDQGNAFYSAGSTYPTTGTISTDTTFTASWSPIGPADRTLSYNANGGTGTAPTAQTGPTNAIVSVAANTFERSGYSFTAWNTAANGSGTSYAAADPYALTNAASQTLYAQWAPVTYTITYNSNGGTGSAASDTFTVLNSATLDDGTGLALTGKTFLGWAISDNSGVAVSSPYLTPGNITLYAIWSGTYTITYSNNGGSGSRANDEFIYNTPTTLFDNTGNVFTRAGYVWSGWTAAANTAPAISTYQIPANGTVYAYWKYTVTYSAGAGSGTVPTQANVALGSSFTVASDSGLSKTGYSFVTWNNGSMGGNYSPSSTYPAASGPVTLTAVWAANFNTVTYDLNGGTGTAPTQANVPTDGSFTVAGSSGFARTGYTFLGWHDGSGIVSGTYAMGSSNVTLTAQWSHDENTYSVTYNAGTGGTGTSYTDSGTATSYNLDLNTFSKAGWSFTGWNTAANGSGTSYTENQTIDLLTSTTLNLFAQWSHNSYEWGVMYDPNGGTGSMFIDSGTSTSFTFAANPFTYPGRTFLGWGESESGPALYQPGDVYDLVMTLGGGVWAIWSHNSYNYSFTYTPGTGSGTPYTETGTATSYTVGGNSQPFSKPGYSFAGWDVEDPGYVYDLVDTTTVTFNALWTQDSQSYSVTYNPNSGSGVAYTDSGTATSYTINGVSPFFKTGYTFVYWETTGGDTYTATQVLSLLSSTTLDLYALWTHNEYNYSVTYNPGTGTGSEYTDSGTASGFFVDANTFSKTGYTFTGWSGGYSPGDLVDLLDSMTVTLTAQWAPNEYTITYNANGGTGSSDSQTYTTDGPAVTLHNDPGVSAPTNYYFVGWTTTQNNVGTLITTYSTNANVTVYAFYNNQYSLMYDSNTANTATPSEYPNDSFTIGGDPFDIINSGGRYAKANYTFQGWSLSPQILRAGEAVNPLYPLLSTITPTQNTTLYAVWMHSVWAYSIKFDAGGGVGTTGCEGSPENFCTGNDDYFQLPANGFTREGYTFSHWSVTTPAETYADQEEINLTGPFNRAGTLSKFVAVWSANTYTITYNANGGTGSSDSQTYTSGNAATTLHNDPGVSRTGYAFAGWTTVANVGPAITTWGNVSGQYSNVTLYALWTANSYTITYNANGGIGSSDSQTYTVGGPVVTLHNSPGVSRSGYNFAGWTTVPNDSDTVITTYSTAANITVYALWAPIFTITYDTDTVTHGGTAQGSIPPTYYAIGQEGPTVLDPLNQEEPAVWNPGYTFGGWTTVINDSMTIVTELNNLESDVTVHALWNPNTYLITMWSMGESDTLTYTTGDEPTTLPLPSASGYTFGGWATTEGDTNTVITTYSSLSDITLYAIWTPNTYTITYDTNTVTYGGTAQGSIDTATYTTGDGPTVLDPLDQEEPAVWNPGYAFGGWTTVINDSMTVVTSLVDITEDTTVYAYWLPIYTITYDTTTATSGSLSPNTDQYITGNAETELYTISEVNAAVQKLNYTFAGWLTVEGDTGTVVTQLAPTEDVTVYAWWTLVTFHVTYNANGGTGSIPQTDRISGNPAVTLSPITGITRAGYNFAGWTLSPNNPATAITTYAGEADVTVYAYWVLQPPATNTGGNEVVSSYTVTFLGNGATGGATAPQTSNVATALTSNGFTRTGFTFTGWNTNPSGPGLGAVAYANGATYNFGSNVTLYAQWAPVIGNVFTVTYNGNGATGGATASQTTGGPIIIAANGFTRTGFTFVTWGLSAAGSGVISPNSLQNISSDLTLYAQWAAIPVPASFTITFDGNGATGGSVAAQSGSAPAALTSNSFVRTGFTFAGWNTNAAGTGTAYADGASYAFNANVTLYAQWTAVAVVYTVNFDSQGGSAVAAIAYNAGNSITLPGAPTREGFTFDGWFAAPNGGSALSGTYTPSGNVTLYAQWTGDEVTVRFDSNGGSRVADRNSVVGARINLPTPNRGGGFRFVAWFTAETGGARLRSPYTVRGDVTLYARWASPELIGAVLFPNNILNIVNASQRAALNAIAAEIVQNKFTIVSLTGYFSNTGTLTRNKVLAAGRAASAERYLKVRLAQLDYDGVTRWTTNSSLVANFGSDAANRRVQIFGS